MISRLSLLGAVAALAVTAACGGDAPPAAQPAEAAPEGVFGVAPQAVGGTPSVVSLAGGALPESDFMAPHINQQGLVFDPTQLIARVGDTVVVTNSETIAHNVHVQLTDTDSTVFLADTDPGGHVQFVLDHEGGYDITCDEHPGMRSFVYATSASRAVFAARDGAFTLPDVPEGSYSLSVWSVDPAKRRQMAVDVRGPSTEVTLVPPGS
jgi:plastocyanin